MIIISIIIIILMFCLLLKDKLKPRCYNFWHAPSTSKFYKKTFHKIKNNSKILDVGVGTGVNLVNNKNVILNKNLHIHGIDIDKAYNNYCKKLVSNYNLDDNIKIELKCLFDIDDKYDYIIFGQSYPVIDNELITKMLKHGKKLLNENGNIIFIHNLVDNNKKNIFYKIKPYIKYIPFIWIDSGYPTAKKDFEKWLSNINLKYNYNIIHTDKFFDLNLNVYMYICNL